MRAAQCWRVRCSFFCLPYLRGIVLPFSLAHLVPRLVAQSSVRGNQPFCSRLVLPIGSGVLFVVSDDVRSAAHRRTADRGGAEPWLRDWRLSGPWSLGRSFLLKSSIADRELSIHVASSFIFGIVAYATSLRIEWVRGVVCA